MDILKYQNTELSSTFKPLSISTHSGINAHFSKNADDFVVRELPLYAPSKNGEHMMIHVQKKGLSTKEMLSAFSAFTGAKMRDIGYAGLKDKEGLTSQYITIPAKFCGKLSAFSHQNIKILSSALHANKLRVGHLAGNAFFIRLKKVSKTDALKLEQALANTLKNGVPNYFGYQRFGKFGDNAKSGFQLLSALKEGKKPRFNPKMSNFLISAFQSELFNRWLSLRVELSHYCASFSAGELRDIFASFGLNESGQFFKELKAQGQFFKLFKGDALGHYPRGAMFSCDELEAELKAFGEHKKTAVGPLFGKKMFGAFGVAEAIENIIISPFSDTLELMNGSRRPAIIWADNLSYKYDEQNAHFSLSFELIKGAYATNFLREVLGRDDIFNFFEED